MAVDNCRVRRAHLLFGNFAPLLVEGQALSREAIVMLVLTVGKEQARSSIPR